MQHNNIYYPPAFDVVLVVDPDGAELDELVGLRDGDAQGL